MSSLTNNHNNFNEDTAGKINIMSLLSHASENSFLQFMT